MLAANPGLGERERKLIADTMEAMAKKLLHTPQMALRNDDAEGVPLVVAVQRLFALEVAAPAPLEAEADDAAAPAGDLKDKKAAGR